MLHRRGRSGRPLLGDVPGAGVGREEVEGAAEHDRLYAGLGSGQQEMVGATGGGVEPVEVAGQFSGSDRGEVDEGVSVGNGLLGKGWITQIADEVVLGRGAGGDGDGIHGADLVGGLPASGERLPQSSGTAGNHYTHLFLPP